MWRWGESNPRPEKEMYMCLQSLVIFYDLDIEPLKITKQFYTDLFCLSVSLEKCKHRVSENDTQDHLTRREVAGRARY